MENNDTDNDAKADEATSAWERRLLPLMSSMVVGLTLFFFIVSLVQLTYLHLNIDDEPPVDFSQAFSLVQGVEEFDQRIRAAELIALAELDASALERRHHQANVFLMARVWSRYMGFVTGMILAMVGAVFILGKLSIPKSSLETQSATLKMSLQTTSPGLIMIALGVALMIATIAINHEIRTTDRSSYVQLLSGEESQANGKPRPPGADELFDQDKTGSGADNQDKK